MMLRYLMVFTAAAFTGVCACSAPPTACAGVGRESPTLPDTVTIKTGAATIAVAGESYGVCLGEPENPPPRSYVWTSSNEVVATVVAIDSIHASIVGRSPGTAQVTPRYVNGGGQLTAVRVTVVP